MNVAVPTFDTITTALDLQGRCALVAGAGNGLGRASAALLGAARATVVCADIDGSLASASADDIVGGGGSARAVTIDVTDRRQVDQLVSGVYEQEGRIDILLNSVGTTAVGAVVDYPEEQYDRLFEINVKGTFLMCQAVGRIMCAQGAGSIVNVSSGAVDFPTANRAVYAMTKAAVAQLTHNLAVEWGPSGVRVNVLAPGFFPSGLTQHNWLGPDGRPDHQKMTEVRERFASEQVLPILGEASDQAFLVLYLASDASRFVTGQILRANGGLGMPW
jgi:3-oxoacyl-[acyl-carrier protein] reductase